MIKKSSRSRARKNHPKNAYTSHQWRENHKSIGHPFLKNGPTNEVQEKLFGIHSIQSLRIKKHIRPMILAALESGALSSDMVTQIIQMTRGRVQEFAYRAHNGLDWRGKSLKQMEKNLMLQLNGGRSMEILLAESLMRLDNGSTHFLAARELDNFHKIDLFSQLTTEEKNPINFGIQVTMSHISKNPDPDFDKENGGNKWEKKFNDIRKNSKKLYDPEYRSSIQENFWKAYVPDILAFSAINGKVFEYMRQHSNIAGKFFEVWKRENFQQKGLLDFFPKDFRERIKLISSAMSEGQMYCICPEFLENSQKNHHFRSNATSYLFDKIGIKFEKMLEYDCQEKMLTLSLFEDDGQSNELLMRTVFFLQDHDFERIKNLHKKS